MILLLGGTTEGARIARALTDAGHPVLLSQATEIEMELPSTELLSVRRGRLDREGFARLVRERRIRAVVDASHPFATGLREVVHRVCRDADLRRIRYERTCFRLPPDAIEVPDHATAAERAFGISRKVVLTTGSKTLTDYVQAARARDVELWARIAPSEESRRSVEEAGLPGHRVEWAKGPFDLEQNLSLLRRSGAGVLVTKDSGILGGLPAKFEAAARCGVPVVVVARPALSGPAVSSIPEILAWLRDRGPGPDANPP